MSRARLEAGCKEAAENVVTALEGADLFSSRKDLIKVFRDNYCINCGLPVKLCEEAPSNPLCAGWDPL